jgi:glycosyltransferase involved in cell wall biosynthesis
MDLLVLPSYREGFSRVIVEASACGVPVVTTDVRGCRDAVLDGQTGILIPPYQPEELASAVRNLLLEKTKRLNMEQMAREHAVQHFDQDKVIDHITQAYIGLLGKHTKNRID